MGDDTKERQTAQYRLLFYVKLNADHLNPGRIQHNVNGTPVPHPFAVTIEKTEPGPDDDEVLIRYLDEKGNELTHSHSYSLDDAFKDAHYEFGIHRYEWVTVTPVDQNSN
jgi:hypothetical protein